jgi:hypothetical protein
MIASARLNPTQEPPEMMYSKDDPRAFGALLKTVSAPKLSQMCVCTRI